MPLSLDIAISEQFRITPIQKEALKKLGIRTIEDLLYHFPARYGDTAEARSIDSLTKGDTAVIYGKITGLKASKGFHSRITMASATVEDESGRIQCVWFNQPYIAKMTPEGALVRIEGKISERRTKKPKQEVSLVDTAQRESASIAAGQQAGTRVSELMSDEAKSVKLAKIDDDGVTFKSIIDGSTHRFTPERSIEIQHAIGADIIFAFDECLSPQESYEKQKAAVERTHAWAQRCLDAHRKADVGDSFSGRFGPSEGEGEPAATRPRVDGVSRKILSRTSALFGIVQGGRHEDLRRHSAKTIGSMDFDGFGIGGSFDKDDIGTAVGWVCEELPENKPRHLLGIGEPEDLILGIENGIDTFDCVAPTRIARNGAAYIKGGRINLFNAQFVSDFTPIEKDCGCYTCTNYTKAYLAHLFRAKEMLAATLTSIHNLYFLVHLVKNARKAIVEGKWGEFRRLHT